MVAQIKSSLGQCLILAGEMLSAQPSAALLQISVTLLQLAAELDRAPRLTRRALETFPMTYYRSNAFPSQKS